MCVYVCVLFNILCIIHISFLVACVLGRSDMVESYLIKFYHHIFCLTTK